MVHSLIPKARRIAATNTTPDLWGLAMSLSKISPSADYCRREEIWSHRGRRYAVFTAKKRWTEGDYPNWVSAFDGKTLVYPGSSERYSFFGDQGGCANPSKAFMYDKESRHMTVLLFQGPNLSKDGDNGPHRVCNALREKAPMLEAGEPRVHLGHLVMLDTSHQMNEIKTKKGWKWPVTKTLSAEQIAWTARELFNIIKDFKATTVTIVPAGLDAMYNVDAIHQKLCDIANMPFKATVERVHGTPTADAVYKEVYAEYGEEDSDSEEDSDGEED